MYEMGVAYSLEFPLDSLTALLQSKRSVVVINRMSAMLLNFILFYANLCMNFVLFAHNIPTYITLFSMLLNDESARFQCHSAFCALKHLDC